MGRGRGLTGETGGFQSLTPSPKSIKKNPTMFNYKCGANDACGKLAGMEKLS